MSKEHKKIIDDKGEEVFLFSRCVECRILLPEKVLISPSCFKFDVEGNIISYPSEAFCSTCSKANDREFLYGV